MRHRVRMLAHWPAVVLVSFMVMALWGAAFRAPIVHAAESAAQTSAVGSVHDAGPVIPAGGVVAAVADNGGDDDNHDGGPGGSDGDEAEEEGILLTRPDTLTGIWTLRVEDSITVTVVATATTRFDTDELDGYVVGSWLEVKGTRQADGSILAKRIHLDHYEVGELVVRLENAAYSMTLASKYDLLLTSTLLQDANIYLYSTGDEDEPELADKVAREPDVMWAEVNYVNSVPEGDGYKTWGWGGPDEPGAYTGQSAYTQVSLNDVARAFSGAGVTVAVLDTGVYTPHEQFVGRLQLSGLDVVDDDTDASEVGPGLAWGHGTHVTGIIAVIAPQATLLPIRVLDPNGRGNTFLLAYAIEWAVDHGADVINMSLGTEFDSQVLRDVVAQAAGEGVVLVAAAGNSDVTTVQYPAGYPGVIGVTAVDEHNVKAVFANYGAGWVDLAAPGVGIMSTMISADGPGYATWSGTSMSTAFVSGAAAQVEGKTGATVAADSMHDLLVDTGTDIDAANPDYARQIGRLLNVSSALGIGELYLPHAQR